jgi:hypothetical protein
VALGRAFLSNPDLVERLRNGAPLNSLRDNLMYVGGQTGYTDYPVLATDHHQTDTPEPVGSVSCQAFLVSGPYPSDTTNAGPTASRVTSALAEPSC